MKWFFGLSPAAQAMIVLVGVLLSMVPAFNLIAEFPLSFFLTLPARIWLVAPCLLGLALVFNGLGFTRTSVCCTALALAKLTVVATFLLSFELHAFQRPLADGWLFAADRAIGVDWRKIVERIGGDQGLLVLLDIVYHTIYVQILILIPLIALTRPLGEAYRFISVIALSSILGIILATLAPGIGMLEWTDPKLFPQFDFAAATPAEVVHAMRSHDVSAIDLAKARPGMLTFPSFHAIYAAAYMYGFRNSVLKGPAILLNAIMIFAAIAFGAHYVVDLIAGVLCVAVSAALLHMVLAKSNAAIDLSTPVVVLAAE